MDAMLCQITLTLSLTAMSCHTLILEPKITAATNLESMTNFLKDLKRDYLDVEDHRQITVLARNINLLRNVNPLYQDHPIYTGRHANITRSLEYSNIGYVFIFVDNLKDDYLNVCFQDFPNTYKAKIILVVFGSLTVGEIRKMYEMVKTRKTLNILVIHFYENVAQLYRPQVEYKTCTYRANVVGNWSVETGLRMDKKVFEKLMNYQMCPVRIVTLNLEPVMRVTEDNNETLRIVGGLEGKIILTFADYMNFTPIVKYPQKKKWTSWKTSSEESDLIDNLVMGKADIGVGQLRPTNTDRLQLDFSFTYNYECLTWTVPLIIDWNKNLLFSEFSTISWILIILIIILSAVQQYISCLRNWNIGSHYSCFSFLFQSFSITLGHPVPISVQKRAEKLHYTLYLIYALIITVAYKTSLAQQLTLRLGIPMILNEQEIINNQLRIAGPRSFLQILNDQASENHLVHELMKRYEVMVDADEAANLISTEQNLAYIRHRSTMDYIRGKYLKSGKIARFYTFPDTCVISYDPVMLLPKGSPLLISLNLMIRKLREFGIPAYWKNSDAITDKVYTSVVHPQKFSIKQLSSIFLIYIFGMLFSSIAFILELVYKSNSHRNVLTWLSRSKYVKKASF